ncbi:MAG TPA: sigma factor, partial [Phycisphaerae bacterium]
MSRTFTAAAEPQRALWEEYEQTRSERLRGELEAQNLHLVETLARQLAKKLPESVDVHDLVQEGFLGLRRAVERYELARGFKFSTYAQSAIWGAMMDSLRRDDAGTRGERRDCTELAEQRSLLGHELGRPPSDEELAEAMGVSWEKVSRITRWSDATTVASVGAGRNRGMADERRLQWPADESAADPALEAQWRDMRELLLRGFAP